MKHLIFFALLIVASCSHQGPIPLETTSTSFPPATPETIEDAVASPFRTESFKVRDIYRHPVETLNFFRVKPEMTVVEISPGNGWYLEILAPFLHDKGQYVMASRVPAPAPGQPNAVADWSKKYPTVAKKIIDIGFDLSVSDLSLGAPASADMVLTFRNVHNWMSKNTQDIAFKSFFKVLKKGGILGVVEHRAFEKNTDPLAKSGYVRESDVIKMAKKAGFRLLAKSEINANPKDTKDHPEGVWTLPPTLKLKDQDREKYLAIGESDRMTLKFIKP
jgi:predicted methyltransferase